MNFVRPYLHWLLLLAAILGSNGAIVHGVARNSEGEPVFNASITLSGTSAWQWQTTDPSGAFAFNVEPGAYTISLDTTLISHRLLNPPDRELVVCGEDVEVTFEIVTVQYPRRILGRLIDERSGEGIRGTVSASTRVRNQSISVNIYADDWGNFSLPAFGGYWTVSATSASDSDRLNSTQKLHVPPDKDANVILPIRFADLAVQFLFTNANSNSLLWPSGTVSMEANGTTFTRDLSIDWEGKCFTKLSEGNWRLRASTYDSECNQKISIATGNTNFVITLRPYPWWLPPSSPPLGTISGKVKDESGVPLANFLICTSQGAQTNTDNEGAFALLTSEGNNRIAASSTNYIFPSTEFLVAEIPLTNMQVILHRVSSVLNLSVAGSLGSVFDNTIISAKTYTNGWLYIQYGVTDCEGHARLNLFPGEWFVSADVRDKFDFNTVSVTRRVAISAGTNQLAVTLEDAPQRTFFTANVVDEQGGLFPYANVSVSSQKTRYPTPSAPVLLSPGRWRASCQSDALQIALTFDVPPNVGSTNLTLIHKQTTNAVAVRVLGVPDSNEVYVSASTFLNGTNYTVNESTFGTNSCVLKLFAGEWQISAQPIDFFYGYYSSYTNCIITNSTTEVLLDSPEAYPSEYSENAETFHGKVIDEDNVAWPFARVNFTPAGNDGTFSTSNLFLNVSHPLFPFSISFENPKMETNTVLVLPRSLIPVDFVVVGSQSSALPTYLVATLRSGPTNYETFPELLENGHYMAHLIPGDWNVYSWNDADLNAHGYQCLTNTTVRIAGPTNIVLQAAPLAGDARKATLLLSPYGTNLILQLQSQTYGSYQVEESHNLQSWRTVGRAHAYGWPAGFISVTPRTNNFYRAFWLEDNLY